MNRILVALGFATATSCEILTPAMYGMPHMDFEVSGKVVTEDQKPIPGIKVTCRSNGNPETANATTAADGSFSVSGNNITADLRLEDIDGPENGGEFEELITEIEVTKIKEGKGWYMGRFEAKDVVIEMKKKQ